MKNIFYATALSIVSFVAHAAPISDLHNTGAGLPAGTQDTNYTVTNPDKSTNYGYSTDTTSGFPVAGAWVPDTATSAWVTPFSNPNGNYPVGTYDWKTTFDLTGFDPASASFHGRSSADDRATIFLNGQQIGSVTTFTQWSDFESSPGFFLPGVNTLEFQVVNDTGPTGLRVEISDSNEIATVAPVPEPETYVMMLAGLGVLSSLARRRKSL